MSQMVTLPPDVQAAIDDSQAKVAAKLEEFARYVSGCRDEAVKARLSSGIEKVWIQAEEDYLGIDDHQRSGADDSGVLHEHRD